MKHIVSVVAFLAVTAGLVYAEPLEVPTVYLGSVVLLHNSYDLGKPDLMIKNEADTHYMGDNTYNDDAEHQTKEQSIGIGQTAVYHVKIQNDADYQRLPDNIGVDGDSSLAGFEVTYHDAISGGSDITDQVTKTGWDTGPLDYGDYIRIRLEVTVTEDAEPGSSHQVLITGESDRDPNQTDAVKAVTHYEYQNRVEESTPSATDFDVETAPGQGLMISFYLSEQNQIELSIYDVTGSLVAKPIYQTLETGNHHIQWRKGDEAAIPSGIYFVRLAWGNYSKTRKAVFIR